MATTTMSLKECKEGSYIMLDGEPCKVVDFAKSKPGKHGSAKVRLDAVGLFDGKKRNFLSPADTDVEVPIIEKRKGQIVSLAGAVANVMDLEDYSTFETAVPDEFSGKLQAGSEIEYWRFNERILIRMVKNE